MLMKVSTYLNACFAPGDAPDPRTVHAWWEKGQIAGEKRGRVLYVDPDRDPSESPATHQPAPRPVSPAAQRLVDQVLRHGPTTA